MGISSFDGKIDNVTFKYNGGSKSNNITKLSVDNINSSNSFNYKGISDSKEVSYWDLDSQSIFSPVQTIVNNMAGGIDRIQSDKEIADEKQVNTAKEWYDLAISNVNLDIYGTSYFLDSNGERHSVYVDDAGIRRITADNCTFYYDRDGNLASIDKKGTTDIYKDGVLVKTLYKKFDPTSETSICREYSADGSSSYYRIDKNGKKRPISIYDEENESFGQFGADQMAFEDDFAELIRDKDIYKEMQKYYPEESFASKDEAMEFYERYFSVITNVGCGYAAATNVVFKEYEGREKEFEDTFGFSMYTVDDDGYVDFNYELFMLKYYNYCYAGKYPLEEMEKGIEIGNPLEDFFTTDAKSTTADVHNLDEFLKDEYDLDMSAEQDWFNRFTIFGSDDDIDSNTKNHSDSNDYIIYGGDNWDLYDMNGTKIEESGGGHYMTIVDYTSDGKPIVTSWGRKYILDIKGEKNGMYRLDYINF